MLAQDVELLLEYSSKLQIEQNIFLGLYFENKELAYITISAHADPHTNDIDTKLYVNHSIINNLTRSYDIFKRIIKDQITQEELRREYVLRKNTGC